MSREEEWYKTMAEKTGKSVEELKEYRREAEKQAEKDSSIRDPQAYATAVMMRRAQETGKEAHKKIGEDEKIADFAKQLSEVLLPGDTGLAEQEENEEETINTTKIMDSIRQATPHWKDLENNARAGEAIHAREALNKLYTELDKVREELG